MSLPVRDAPWCGRDGANGHPRVVGRRLALMLYQEVAPWFACGAEGGITASGCEVQHPLAIPALACTERRPGPHRLAADST